MAKNKYFLPYFSGRNNNWKWRIWYILLLIYEPIWLKEEETCR